MGHRRQNCQGTGAVSSFEYRPYVDRTPVGQIAGYPRSFTRTPRQRLIKRPLTGGGCFGVRDESLDAGHVRTGLTSAAGRNETPFLVD